MYIILKVELVCADDVVCAVELVNGTDIVVFELVDVVLISINVVNELTFA